MKLNYINKIKANISIHSNKRSTNILEGTYKSIYRGKSMNFENLREYTLDDDVKDIDWKSSARNRIPLVKQFIAEKKHNILLIVDTGLKMMADTDKHESKKELALFSAGTIGYLAIKNNDYVAMLFKDRKVVYKPFKYNLYNLEQYLCDYAANKQEEDIEIEELIEYAVKNIPKKKIVFIITDLAGMNSIKTPTLKKLKYNSDISIININDNYMTGEDVFDIKEKNYIPSIFLEDKKLFETEKNIKEKILQDNIDRFKNLNIKTTTISNLEELDEEIIKLLEERKYE